MTLQAMNRELVVEKLGGYLRQNSFHIFTGMDHEHAARFIEQLHANGISDISLWNEQQRVDETVVLHAGTADDVDQLILDISFAALTSGPQHPSVITVPKNSASLEQLNNISSGLNRRILSPDREHTTCLLLPKDSSAVDVVMIPLLFVDAFDLIDPIGATQLRAMSLGKTESNDDA